MNKFVTGALALAAASSVGFADPSEESEWLELDSEINSLASAMTTQGPIGGWAVLIRGNYTYSSDRLISGSASEDISGFKLDDVRIAAWGEVGDYGWRVSMNTESPIGGSSSSANFEVEDAYVHFACTDYLTVMMGQYRPHFMRSGFVWEENLLMINRTVIGTAFSSFVMGAGAEGSYEEFSWQANVLNGQNGKQEDHIWQFRVEYDLNGGAGEYEGAYGSGDDLVGTVGFMYLTDDTASTGNHAYAWGIDASGSFSQIGFGFEVLDLGSDEFLPTDLYQSATNLSDPNSLGLTSDTTPYTLTVSYLINMEFEFGVRWQDTDNATDDQLITFGLAWYQSGKNAHWNFEITDINSDIDDATVYQIGYTVGGST
jgi:hypothetical protein